MKRSTNNRSRSGTIKPKEKKDNCICCDYDGKGVSCCGTPCPIHSKEKKMNEFEGYCHNCMVGEGIVNVPEEKCRCSCHKNYERTQLKASILPQLLKEIEEKIEGSTPRYLKGGELRNQYFVKGWNECRDEILKLLTK